LTARRACSAIAVALAFTACDAASESTDPRRTEALAAAAAIAPKQERPVVRTAVPGLPLPTCAELEASGLDASAQGDAFYERYPKELAGEDSVEQVALDEAAIGSVVGHLACAARLAGYDPVVVESGLALFASRRHGARALAALEGVATGSGAEAAGARRFAEQVRGYLAGPSE
jgi:hypothetical protein